MAGRWEGKGKPRWNTSEQVDVEISAESIGPDDVFLCVKPGGTIRASKSYLKNANVFGRLIHERFEVELLDLPENEAEWRRFTQELFAGPSPPGGRERYRG